jgi:hypothetical protein
MAFLVATYLHTYHCTIRELVHSSVPFHWTSEAWLCGARGQMDKRRLREAGSGQIDEIAMGRPRGLDRGLNAFSLNWDARARAPGPGR